MKKRELAALTGLDTSSQAFRERVQDLAVQHIVTAHGADSKLLLLSMVCS